MFDSADVKKLGKYTVGNTLGSGMFKVKLVQDEKTKESYAAKICKDSFSKYKLAKEASILSELNKAGVANIIKMIEYVEPDQGAQRKAGVRAENLNAYQCRAALILELAANDTIFEYVLASKGFEEKLARSYFKELITTVSNIHNLGYVHRDIKLENILVDSNYNMKLADFGFARSFDESNKDKMMTRLGTEYYIAPEMRRQDPYAGVKIDTFSCGVVLFIMIFGRPPFRQASSVDPLYKHFSDEQPEKFWEKVERKLHGEKEYNMTLKLLINDLLASDPDKRPTASQILKYEWVQQEIYTPQEISTSMAIKKTPISREVVGRDSMISLIDLYANEQRPKSVIQTASKENHTRWFIENLTLERRIGVGAYSKVYSAHSTDKSECAIKIIDDLTQPEMVDYLKKLVPASGLSGSLAHSINTVHIHRFENRLTWKGNSKVFQIVIIMEKLVNSLWEIHREKVRTGIPWTEDQLVKLLVSICNALSEASKRELPHYDLHEKNIFFDETSSLFLVGDFGVPKIIKHRKNNAPYESDYLAPEAKGVQGIKDEIDFYKADVYSLGLILVKLLSMKENFPIQDRTKIEALLKEKKGDYPFIVQVLEEHMLVLDPVKREDARNVKYFILTINFDLAFGATNAKDVLLKKKVLPGLNLDINLLQTEYINMDISGIYQRKGL